MVLSLRLLNVSMIRCWWIWWLGWRYHVSPYLPCHNTVAALTGGTMLLVIFQQLWKAWHGDQAPLNTMSVSITKPWIPMVQPINQDTVQPTWEDCDTFALLDAWFLQSPNVLWPVQVLLLISMAILTSAQWQQKQAQCWWLLARQSQAAKHTVFQLQRLRMSSQPSRCQRLSEMIRWNDHLLLFCLAPLSSKGPWGITGSSRQTGQSALIERLRNLGPVQRSGAAELGAPSAAGRNRPLNVPRQIPQSEPLRGHHFSCILYTLDCLSIKAMGML